MSREIGVRIDRKLNLRRKHKRFFARFIVQGKRRQFILGHFKGDNPTEAEADAAEKALDELLVQYERTAHRVAPSRPGQVHSLRHLASAYEEHRASLCSPRHLEEIKRHLDQLCRFQYVPNATLGDLSLEELREEHLRSYLETMRIRRKWGPVTIRHAATHAKAAVHWATVSNLMPRDPWQVVKRPIPPRVRRRVLTHEEINALLAACDERIPWSVNALRDKVILALLYDSAARPIELTRARWEDYHGEYIVIDEHKTQRHTGQPIQLYVSEFSRPLLEQYRAGKTEGWLFPGQDGKQFDRSAINRMFRRIVKRMPPDLQKRLSDSARAGRVSPYTLRRTRGTDLHDAKVPPATAAKILHNSPEIFLNTYVQTVDDRVREALKVNVPTPPKTPISARNGTLRDTQKARRSKR